MYKCLSFYYQPRPIWRRSLFPIHTHHRRENSYNLKESDTERFYRESQGNGMSASKTKKWTTKYEEQKILGNGGNADVFLVIDKNTHTEVALKSLRNRSEEKKIRFRNEIKIEHENAPCIQGILPVIDYDLEDFWYTMPIAIPVIKAIQKMDICSIIKGVIELSETLGQLHDKGIYHRDIKPSNIYHYGGRFSFGDFGLVDFPESEDLTQSDKGLGAIFTIAPEMKRNPKIADASKADVYSLAKTLWMFLSGDEKGFDGVYDYLDESHSLRFVSRFKNEHLVELDELLKDSTENNPDFRPNIHEFQERLLRWSAVSQNYEQSQLSDWQFLKKQLFGKYVPLSSTWRGRESIVSILSLVGSSRAYNHMLFSSGGGLDFSRAELAPESGCIYIYDTIGFCFVVKPNELVYEGFSDDYRWSYFLLNLENMDPIVHDNPNIGYENLVEDYPGHYVDGTYSQYGVYDYETGAKLPEGFKTVQRYNKGSFLIVLKNGPYNHISATYDGRHGLCSVHEFRQYMESLKKEFDRLMIDAANNSKLCDVTKEDLEQQILHLPVFEYNPFANKEKVLFDISVADNDISERRESFINSNFTKWSFKNKLLNSEAVDDKKARYCFQFIPPSNIVDYFGRNQKLLSMNGHIVEDIDPADVYYVYSRENAIRTLNNSEKAFDDILRAEGLYEEDDFHMYFQIELCRINKPSHLFTYEEIQELMRNADDRTSNRLVIDENGFAQIISTEEIGYTYPVYHESWDAGNNYVGKYSSLLTAKDDYVSSLQGWLLYLKTGRAHYIDYIRPQQDVEELINEIKTYY